MAPDSGKKPRKAPVLPPALTLKDIFGTGDIEEIEAKIDKQLKRYDKATCEFEKHYCTDSKPHQLTHSDLEDAINQYFNLNEEYDKISNPLYMALNINHADEDIRRIYQKAHKKLGECHTRLRPFIRALSYLEANYGEKCLEYYASTTLSNQHKYYIGSIQTHPEGELSEDAIKALETFTPLLSRAAEAYTRFIALATFEVAGNQLSYGDLTDTIRYPKDLEIQEKAVKILETFLNDTKTKEVATDAFNAAIENAAALQKIYRYEQPHSDYHADNDIDEKIVEKMVAALHQSNVAERYFHKKAEMMGKNILKLEDKWASIAGYPLPVKSESMTRKKDSIGTIRWESAVDIVVSAFRHFSEEMGQAAQEVFDSGRIDAKPRLGKEEGIAWTRSCGASDEPWILCNYRGRIEDIVTLAHEVGHAVGFKLANRQQGNILNYQNTLITEVAASMGEDLVFKELERRLATSTDPKKSTSLQITKIENTLLMLQRGYEYNVAVNLHKTSNKEERPLSTEEISDAWLKEMQAFTGNAVDPETISEMGWAENQQYMETPFYPGDYAMTKLITLALLDQVEKGERTMDDLSEKFVNYLKAGGTKEAPKLLEELGTNITEKGFWSHALKTVDKMVDELEKSQETDKKASHAERITKAKTRTGSKAREH